MNSQTQAAIENNARAEVHPVFDAQHPQEWLLDLGGRKALFHPEMKQWMWFDALHEEWVLAGFGAGEAILMAYGKTGGLKKLPQPGAVEDWCVYFDLNVMRGPELAGDLYTKLLAGVIPLQAKIWSTCAVEWLIPGHGENGEFILSNEAGNPVLRLSRGGFSPAASD